MAAWSVSPKFSVRIWAPTFGLRQGARLRRTAGLPLSRHRVRYQRPLPGHTLCRSSQVHEVADFRDAGSLRLGLRLVGYARTGAHWSPPANHLEQEQWSNIEIRTTWFPGHPQETTENSVYMAHFRYVHGYGSVSRTVPVSIDGPSLESRFDFTTTRRIAKFVNINLDLSASTLVCGLGYSLVEIREKSIGLHLRLWVLATTVDGAYIDLSLATQVGEIRKPERWVTGLGFLPVRLRAPVMIRLMLVLQKQDVTIWSRKRYVNRPSLCDSDGEIMPFRAYCAQFCTVSRDSEDLVAVTPDLDVR